VQELGEERLETMSAVRTLARHKARMFERRQKLARRAARGHGLVVVDPFEQRPAEDRVLIAAVPRRRTSLLKYA